MASNNACCAVFLTFRPGQVGNLRGDGARNLEIVDGAGGVRQLRTERFWCLRKDMRVDI